MIDLSGATTRGKRVTAVFGVATMALLLGACGQQSQATDSVVEEAQASAECGTFADIPANDPEGIVAGLPVDLQAAFNGYPNEVKTSAFADADAKEGPWKVGLLLGANLNDFTASSIEKLEEKFQEAKEAGLVEGELLTSWAADAASQSPATQVAGFQELVRAGADAIITVPLAGDAMAAAVDEAGKQGVVTVSYGGYIPSAYALNVYQNPYLHLAEVTSRIMADIGGEGDVLMVRGMPILPIDPQQYDAAQAVLSNCENVEVVGEVEGGFTKAGAKTAALQWLTSHPGDVDAVIQLNAMGPGVISAFEQAGRTVPPVSGNTAQVGDVAYLHENAANGYKTYLTPIGGAGQTEAAFRIAMRTLAGEGPKGTEFTFIPEIITADTVDDYFLEGTNLNSPGDVSGPDQSILPDEQLDAFFNNPSAS